MCNHVILWLLSLATEIWDPLTENFSDAALLWFQNVTLWHYKDWDTRSTEAVPHYYILHARHPLARENAIWAPRYRVDLPPHDPDAWVPSETPLRQFWYAHDYKDKPPCPHDWFRHDFPLFTPDPTGENPDPDWPDWFFDPTSYPSPGTSRR